MVTGTVFHQMLIFASASVIAAMGALLIGIHFPEGEQWEFIRKARFYMVLSYLILAMLSAASCFIHENGNTEARDVVILLIASTQALFFTMTLLTFIQPGCVRRRKVIPRMLGILAVGLLLLGSLSVNETIFHAAFYIAVAGYLSQLTTYTLLFRRKYSLCLKQMEDYYDEEDDHRLKWVQTAFHLALIIGVIPLLVLLVVESKWVYDLFILLYTAFYVYMTQSIINYGNKEVKFILPAVNESAAHVTERNETGIPTMETHRLTEKERRFKEALQKWTVDKQFVLNDIGVEEIAQSLDSDSTFLRYYFRTYIQNDFRTWRSELRIRESQRIIEDNPSIPLSEVYRKVGFNDKGNFHRQFMKFTGSTPTAYKENSQKRPKIINDSNFKVSGDAGTDLENVLSLQETTISNH